MVYYLDILWQKYDYTLVQSETVNTATIVVLYFSTFTDTVFIFVLVKKTR